MSETKLLLANSNSCELSNLDDDDHRELLELMIMFLGGQPILGVGLWLQVRCIAPDVWQKQITLWKCSYFVHGSNSPRGRRRSCNVYLSSWSQTAWYNAPFPSSAAVNDLAFFLCQMKKLQFFLQLLIHKCGVVETCISYCGHLYS